MLNVYGTANGCLTEFPEAAELPADAVWIDLVEPTANEDSKVEGVLGIDIPKREELAEIEASSRLYQEDGAVFMTANLIRRGDNDEPESSPVTFIIKDNTLIFYPYFRSWDLWGGFPANLAGIAVLQKTMADEIGVEAGPIVASSKGLHIYGYVEELAKLRTGK